MRVFQLAIKDIAQILRDKKSLLFLLVMPLAFTYFMGVAFNTPVEKDNRLSLGWVNHDTDGILSRQIEAALEKSTVVKLIPLDENRAGRALQEVQQGKLVGKLEIPTDFTSRTLAGELVPVNLLLDPAGDKGQSARQAIQTALTRVLSTAAIARYSVEEIEKNQPFVDAAARQKALENALAEAALGWDNPATSILVEKAATDTVKEKTNPFAQSSPGMLVQFTIFGLVTASMILVLERKSRTLQRMLTTSMSRPAIIAGHLLANFLLILVQEIILVVFGQLILGVDYLRQPLAVLLVIVAFALWVAAFGLFISVMAKTEEQVILYSLIAMFLFTALGGGWFPLESTGPAFSAVGHMTPAAWAMDGFQNIIVRGLGFNAVLLPAIILTGYALLFFGLAIWRFRFE
jgi:ABC-2 type transport system permease protein